MYCNPILIPARLKLSRYKVYIVTHAPFLHSLLHTSNLAIQILPIAIYSAQLPTCNTIVVFQYHLATTLSIAIQFAYSLLYVTIQLACVSNLLLQYNWTLAIQIFFFRNIIWAIAQKRFYTIFFSFLFFSSFPATGKIIKNIYLFFFSISHNTQINL